MVSHPHQNTLLIHINAFTPRYWISSMLYVAHIFVYSMLLSSCCSWLSCQLNSLFFCQMAADTLPLLHTSKTTRCMLVLALHAIIIFNYLMVSAGLKQLDYEITCSWQGMLNYQIWHRLKTIKVGVWVKVLHPTWHKIGHFRDVLPSHLLA